MTAMTIALGEFGVKEILFVLLIILLLFGGRKIPELMKGLGSGIKEFKNAAKDDNSRPVSTDPIAPTSPLTPPPSATPPSEENRTV